MLYARKNLRKLSVPEICAEMSLISEMAVFLNELYLLNKTIKRSDFFHVNTNLFTLKID